MVRCCRKRPQRVHSLRPIGLSGALHISQLRIFRGTGVAGTPAIAAPEASYAAEFLANGQNRRIGPCLGYLHRHRPVQGDLDVPAYGVLCVLIPCHAWLRFPVSRDSGVLPAVDIQVLPAWTSASRLKTLPADIGGHSLPTKVRIPRGLNMSGPTSSATNVVPLRPTKALKRRSEAKWGTSVMAQGYCIIPALLFRAQRRLGLSATQLALILQIAEFWWEDGRLPWPKKETVADRLNITEKQVQRLVRDLEIRGYLKRVTRMTSHGQSSNAYDFSGLVAKLQELAPEFAEAAAAKRKVERRGDLRRRPA